MAMTHATTKSSKSSLSLGGVLESQPLTSIARELQVLRSHSLERKADGEYTGSILGFVRGLRLSAHVIYYLRERLSHTDLKVSWGHLMGVDEESVSPECDVIIHTKGHKREWNGMKGSIMEFRFIETEKVKAVVSCKSQLTSIDRHYPKALRKYGVQDVFLLAECCRKKSFARLNATAKKAGYRGLWCLYFTEANKILLTMNEKMYVDFGKAVLKAVEPGT